MTILIKCKGTSEYGTEAGSLVPGDDSIAPGAPKVKGHHSHRVECDEIPWPTHYTARHFCRMRTLGHSLHEAQHKQVDLHVSAGPL